MSILKKYIQYSVLYIFTSLSLNAIAHHGSVVNPNMYLAENLIELEGEITEVFWRNPHPRYRMAVSSGPKSGEIWELELNGSPIGYRRAGIGEDDIVRIGEQVKVAGYASKIDAESLGVLHILLTNGQEFVNGRTRALRWSTVRMSAETLDFDPIKVESAIQSAEGLFRVWSSVRSPELEGSDYEHMLTDAGRQLASEYDPIADNQELECRQGMPDTMFDRGSPMELIDEGDRILIHLQEYDVERVIHMNAQQGSMPHEASDLGYSVGHWEADVLVVNTTALDWPYYDEVGIPQSLQATQYERFSVSEDENLLSYEITITDPVVFTAPLTLTTTRAWEPGLEVAQFDCTATWEG